MLKSVTYTNTPQKRSFSCLLALAALSLLVAGNTQAQEPNTTPPVQRGAALGLYSEDPNWSYVNMIEEMRDAGVTHVALVVPYYMKTNTSVTIYKHNKYSVPMSTVARTLGDIRKHGMEVFLFPILRVEDKSNGGWRGTLKPSDPEKFWENYASYILKWARLAEAHQIPLMSIGSELASLDVQTGRWMNIIAGHVGKKPPPGCSPGCSEPGSDHGAARRTRGVFPNRPVNCLDRIAGDQAFHEAPVVDLFYPLHRG